MSTYAAPHDLTIKIHDKNFRVHRRILRRYMSQFVENLPEGDVAKIDPPDQRVLKAIYNVFELFVNHSYRGGRFSAPEDKVYDLYLAGKFFSMPEDRSFLRATIVRLQRINASNYEKRRKFARIHKIPTVLESCKLFDEKR